MNRYGSFNWLTRMSNRVYFGSFAALVVLGGFLRFWQIGLRPGYDWDEPVYSSVARTLANTGVLSGKTVYGAHQVPYLYHPPFYFLELAGWYKLFGTGITQARTLAATMSLVALVLLFGFLYQLMGRMAWLATGLLLVDGWMVYTGRVSYIENSLIVLVVLSFWLYYRAIQHPTTVNFVVAGLGFGAASVFKHIGLYVVVVVLIHWLILGVRQWKREHLILLVTTAACLVIYGIVMLVYYQRAGHNYFWDDSFVQIKRTFGFQSHGGTLNKPSDYIGPLIDQYRVFVGTVVVAVIGVITLIWRAIQCWKARSFDPVRANSLLFSWMVGGVVSLAVIDLKFPQYFELVLIPLYAYLVAELALWFGRKGFKAATNRQQLVASALVMVVAVLGLAAFQWRIVGHSDNALKSMAHYSTVHVPAHAVVLTEESVGDIIPQPFCKLEDYNDQCYKVAGYIITYTSHTQHVPTHLGLHQLITDATKLKVVKGFKETLTLYRINR